MFYEVRKCSCGCTWGKYIDNLNAEYGGEDAVPIGFANDSFRAALENQPETAPGELFCAFVIEKNCPTFKRITRDAAIESLLKERT